MSTTKPKAPRKRKEYASARERFVVLGTDRTKRAIASIERIGNLSSAAYEYDDADVRKIVSALAVALERTEQRLVNRSKAPEPTFSLDGGK